MCFNRNVLIGVAVAAAGVLVVAPGAFGAALPILVLLACPLSMVLMMRGMSGGKDRCATGTGSQAEPTAAQTSSGGNAELARLQAEVDQLKAELAQRGRRADQAR